MNRLLSSLSDSRAKQDILAILMLAIATLAIYHDLRSHTFINYDDQRIITNRIDRYDGINLENITGILFDDYPREEPLIVRDLSYLLNAELFGELDPAGYLIGNLILHIICAFLVYRLSMHLLPKRYPVALIAALLFALHPVNVESVAWISSRKNPLFAVFLLLSFFGYLRFLQRNQIRHLIVSALLFSLALLSKASAISLLPMLIGYRLTLKRDLPWTRHETTFYFVIIATTALFIDWYSGVIQEYGIIKGLAIERDWLRLLLSASEYVTFYISKLAAPITLSTFYDFPEPSKVYDNLSYLAASVAIMIALVTTSILLFKKRQYQALFLIILFFAGLTPYLGLAGVNIFVADRYLYMSSAAYTIGLAWFMQFLYERYSQASGSRIALVSVFSLYCILLAAKTTQTTATWKNNLTFWANANQTAPNRVDTYHGLMNIYTKFAYENPDSQHRQEAIQHAIAIGTAAVMRFCSSSGGCNDDMFKVTSLLGNAYSLAGDFAHSDYYYGMTFKLEPLYIKGRYTYTIDLLARKEYGKLIDQISYIQTNANPYKYSNTLTQIQKVIIPQLPSKYRDRLLQTDSQESQ